MTLRELILSVDPEQYSDSSLYQKLRGTKPEYGSNRRIQLKLANSEISITNAHVGSLGDILLLIEAVPRCPFFHALYVVSYEMWGRVRLRRIGGLALLRIPPIDHEFLLVHSQFS